MASTQTTKNGKGKNGKGTIAAIAPATGAKLTKPAPVGSKQTEIPGAERPKLPPEVEKQAERLRAAHLKRRKEQAKEDKERADLLSLMRRHDVTLVEIVDENDDVIEVEREPGEETIKMRKKQSKERN